MYGGFFAALIGLIVILTSNDVSWWWLLWSFLIGLFVEIVARLGAGEEVADAFVSSIDLVSAISSVGEGVGDIGGDCGGGDCGGGDGGGGGD